MINIKIERSLDSLFSRTQIMFDALKNQDYDLFRLTENIYSEDLKLFLNSTSQNELIILIPQLKKLEQLTQVIQNTANEHFDTLKEQSLTQKRNKHKLTAYK